MNNSQRILQLLESILDSESTPEEACADCPELLPIVKQRWKQFQGIEAEVDAMFPASASGGSNDVKWGSLRSGELPIIPGYHVSGVLGRGGMGVVYIARHLQLNRIVALKMLLSGGYASRSEVARFSREAKIIAGFKHPHLVQVYDVGEAGGCPYFTMELVDGGSLAQLLTGALQSPSHAAKLLATLALAVQAAHEGGIVHRDLKPSNILLTADGSPKISDFGLACRFEEQADLTLSGARIGTPSYMAPEQVTNRTGQVGPLSDIYSLGAILYEMLTGRPPFRADTPADTERQLVANEPVRPSRLNTKVPRDLETICLKCLQKDPRRRYATAKLLADDLCRFLNGEPIVARRTGTIGRSLKWARRRPSHAALVAAGLMIAASVIGISVWFSSARFARTHSVQADLQQALDLEYRGRWDQARTEVLRADLELGNHGPLELRAQLDQRNRDLDVVARLDAIQLNLAPRNQREIEAAYTSALKDVGLELFTSDEASAEQQIRRSPIRLAIAVAISNWALVNLDDQHRRWLRGVALKSIDSQTPWERRLADPLLWDNKVALAKVANDAPIAQEPVAALNLIGMALGKDGIPFLIQVQQKYPTDFWANLTLGDAEFDAGNNSEAIRYLQVAVALRPTAALAEDNLGFALVASGRRDEGLIHVYNAMRLVPSSRGTYSPLTMALVKASDKLNTMDRQRELLGSPDQNPNSALANAVQIVGLSKGLLNEYRSAFGAEQIEKLETRYGKWKTLLDANPSAYPSWSGYAELCLFLHHDDEYRRTRTRLLARFGDTTNPHVAERAGRACLLLPGSDEETREAVALIDRAVNADKSKVETWAPPFFQVAKALADFRQGHFQEASDLLHGPAFQVLTPMPHLVLAMTQQRMGEIEEARKTLSNALQLFDWNASDATDADAWMFHALRRQADEMIHPLKPTTSK